MGFLDKLKKAVVNKGEDKPAPKAEKGYDNKKNAGSDGLRPLVSTTVKAKPAVNHGNSWSAGEEKDLKRNYDRGVSIKELSNIHGRTTEAISHRLIKLGYNGIVTLKRHRSG